MFPSVERAATPARGVVCDGPKAAARPAVMLSTCCRPRSPMSVLTVLPDDVSVLVKPGETILVALAASGYGYRIGCRRGGCGICKVDLLSGSVTYDHPVSDQVLTPEEIASGTVLSCRAVPDGDITIALRDERLKLNSALLRSFRAV